MFFIVCVCMSEDIQNERNVFYLLSNKGHFFFDNEKSENGNFFFFKKFLPTIIINNKIVEYICGYISFIVIVIIIRDNIDVCVCVRIIKKSDDMKYPLFFFIYILCVCVVVR